MNRRETGAGAAVLAVGDFVGARASPSLWQVTFRLFYAAPFFNAMSLLNSLITWILLAAGGATIADGLRRLPRLPMINALIQIPES
jgi:hypothetical protein